MDEGCPLSNPQSSYKPGAARISGCDVVASGGATSVVVPDSPLMQNRLSRLGDRIQSQEIIDNFLSIRCKEPSRLTPNDCTIEMTQ
jgi:hypothetical protein